MSPFFILVKIVVNILSDFDKKVEKSIFLNKIPLFLTTDFLLTIAYIIIKKPGFNLSGFFI